MIEPMNTRVVITGMGVVSPNARNLEAFRQSLLEGRSGIAFHQELADLNFSCQVAGKPEIPEQALEEYFSPLERRGLKSTGLVYGVIAGTDAWVDAGLPIEGDRSPDWESGIIFGTGILGVDKFREAIHLIDQGKTRRLGSTSVLQTMASGISAFLGGRLGCGNQVTTNSSACTTGTEAVLMGYERIRSGKARRMLVGSCSDSGPYLWGGFDAMRILPSQFNDQPGEASRPMSATAAGFVPGSGAGALVLETLDLARERGARIYGEVLGGAVNSGGQRGGGSMTAANDAAVQRCIREAIADAGIAPEAIDLINGHLTATAKDPQEVRNWSLALGREGKDFPLINSLKGMTGHCLSASGSIECVAGVLQLSENFVFGNVNAEDLHPEIARLIHPDQVPCSSRSQKVELLAKASFGFGDVNAVVVFKTYEN